MVNDRNRGRSVTQINDREDDWSEDAIDQLSDAELSDWGYDDSNGESLHIKHRHVTTRLPVSDLTEGNKNDIGQIGLNSGNIGELNFDERRWLEDLMAQTGSRDRKNQIILAENDGGKSFSDTVVATSNTDRPFFLDESQSDEDENDIGQIGINNGLIQEWNYGRRRF
jgi:hypothetical protein